MNPSIIFSDYLGQPLKLYININPDSLLNLQKIDTDSPITFVIPANIKAHHLKACFVQAKRTTFGDPITFHVPRLDWRKQIINTWVNFFRNQFFEAGPKILALFMVYAAFKSHYHLTALPSILTGVKNLHVSPEQMGLMKLRKPNFKIYNPEIQKLLPEINPQNSYTAAEITHIRCVYEELKNCDGAISLAYQIAGAYKLLSAGRLMYSIWCNFFNLNCDGDPGLYNPLKLVSLNHAQKLTRAGSSIVPYTYTIEIGESPFTKNNDQ